MPTRGLLFLGSLIVFLAPSLTKADTAMLGAVKDNTLYESVSGTLSNGSGSYFFAGNTAIGDLRRGLIAFDVAGSVPAGSIIQSVTLTLNMSRARFGSATVSLHRVSADWGEGASNASGEEGQGTAAAAGDATWTNGFSGGALWTTAGGDFSVTVSASQLIAQEGLYSWGSTAQMVADVQGWLDNPSGNFGWIVIGNEAALSSARRFNSRNHSNVSLRPRLTIEYIGGSDPCPKDDPDDTDGDGVCDSDDICPGGNDTVDTDGDGTPNFCDPCPNDNPNDSDGDGVCNSSDVCPGGSDTADTDGDGTPNFCDPCPNDNPNDSDGDGVCNSSDVCPGGNDAVDTDGDGTPNFCDPCPNDNPNDSDGDEVCNSSDVCPGGNDTVDTDGDGTPNFCDPCPLDDPDDSDGDSICDDVDECPGGDDNQDADADGVCDALDRCLGADDRVDVDGDGIPDCIQTIPTVSVWGLLTMALLVLIGSRLRGKSTAGNGANS
jgi:hypothetical protein